MRTVTSTADEPSTQKRRINDLMREGMRLHDPEGPIPFFCECSLEDCYRAVWRSAREYDEARRDEDWRPLAEHAEHVLTSAFAAEGGRP